MSCNSGSTTSTSETSQRIPGWLNEGAQTTWNQATTAAKAPYVPYGGDTVAPMNRLQTDALAQASNVANLYNTSNRTDTADAYFRAFAESPGQPVNVGFYRDPGGMGRASTALEAGGGDPFASIESRMSPYTAGVLEPTLANIREEGQLLRNQIDAGATGAGAYGDARHGVLEAEQMRNQQRTARDATASAYQSAFDRASAERQGDINRYIQTLTGDINRGFSAEELGNRQYETGLERLFRGGGAISDLDTREIAQGTSIANLLSTAGQSLQTQDQKELSDQYQRFLEARDTPQNRINILLGALRAQPNQNTTTQISTVPQQQSNPFMSILGGLAGTALTGIPKLF